MSPLEWLPLLGGCIAFAIIWRRTKKSVSRSVRLAFLMLVVSSVPLYVIATIGTMTLRPAGLRLGAIVGTIAVLDPITVTFGLLALHWWKHDLRTT